MAESDVIEDLKEWIAHGPEWGYPGILQAAVDRITSAESKLNHASALTVELQTEVRALQGKLEAVTKERDRYYAALVADRGEEAAIRIRDEDRAFCNLHQAYFDSDIGCAKCEISERALEQL